MGGSTVSEEKDMLKPRIKLLIAQLEVKHGRKIKHQEIADKLGFTKNYFSQLVNGHSILNNAEKLYELAELLECKVDDLYEYVKEE